MAKNDEVKGIPLSSLLGSFAPKGSPEYEKDFEKFRAQHAYVPLSSLACVDLRASKERLQDDVIGSLRREVAALEERLRPDAPKDGD
jgi:hypothetical protein